MDEPENDGEGGSAEQDSDPASEGDLTNDLELDELELRDEEFLDQSSGSDSDVDESEY